MISQASAPGRTVRADFHTLMERRRIVWDAWGVKADKSEHSSQTGMRGLAIEVLALSAAAGLVLGCVWLFRWAVLSPAVWGLLSPVLATVISVSLMSGLVWLTRMDKSAVSARRRAARRARAARRTQETTLSQAIATADEISLSTGAVWLDKTDTRSRVRM